MTTTKGLYLSTGVDIGHGGIRRLGVAEIAQFRPGRVNIRPGRHIRHGTAGPEVGQHHDLIFAGEDIRRFGHEMHSAKDDEPGLGGGRFSGQIERITPLIGAGDDLIRLIMMT